MAEIVIRKQPVQARSRATCDAIKEAAAQILETRGTGALNTNIIAEKAGVSVGTLYQYFPSKEAILAELVRDMRGEMLADLQRGQKAAHGQDLKTAVQILVSASLDHHRRDAIRAQALEQAEAALRMDDETTHLKQEIHQLITKSLRQYGTDSPSVAARDLTALTKGLAQAAAMAGETNFDEISVRITRAALGYLQAG